MSYGHHYSIADLENLPVFELDMYVDMVAKAIQEEKLKNEGFTV